MLWFPSSKINEKSIDLAITADNNTTKSLNNTFSK